MTWTGAAFLLSTLLAAGLMGFARQALTPRWEVWSKAVPRALVHRWTLGAMAIGSLVLLFSVPFLLVGAYDVAAAGLVVVVAIMALFGRDVSAWIIEDLREHLQERRGLFRHGASCVVHEHYRDEAHPTD